VRNLEFLGLLKQEIRAVDLFANISEVGATPAVEGGFHQFTLRSTKGGKQ
jgi:hypothetical protein